MKIWFFAFLLPLTAAAQMQQASNTVYKPPALRSVGIDQKMGAQAPLDIPFTDDSGRAVTLRNYLGKPVILALVYYSCPSLCNMVLNGVVHSESEKDQVARIAAGVAGKAHVVNDIKVEPR